MRWLLPLLGALGLLAGTYLGLRPRLNRPVLRIALQLKPGDPDDQALAEGLARAIEERDARAGRWRLETGHQYERGLTVDFPEPRAHLMLYGAHWPGLLTGSNGERLSRVDARTQLAVIKAWASSKRVEIGDLYDYNSNYASLGLGPISQHVRNEVTHIVCADPDVVFLCSWGGVDIEHVAALRAAGFSGPLFVSALGVSNLSGFEGAFVVLSPLKPPPPGFSSPFAYTGYAAGIRLFDALDANPLADPLQIAGGAVLTELEDAPRIYEVRNGRLEPSK